MPRAPLPDFKDADEANEWLRQEAADLGCR